MPMTRGEAEAAAMVQWGKDGAAERRQDRDRARRFIVGHLAQMPVVGLTLVVRGAGASFEDAFRDAATHPDSARTDMPSGPVLLEMAKAQALADMSRDMVVKAARGSKSGTMLSLLLDCQREVHRDIQVRLEKSTPARNIR